MQISGRQIIPAIAAIGFLTLVDSFVGDDSTKVPADRACVSDFQREALLAKFDRDADGHLNANERSALRKSFGNIDVPMLPARTHRYAVVSYPPYVDKDELKRIDNTPTDNPTTDSGATLGRILFYDTQLSRNNTIACASCHLQRAAFSDPERFSLGYASGRTTRNAMSLVNLRYSDLKGHTPGFFWDERAPTLEAQALIPIQDPIEMGMDLSSLEARLQALPYYPPLFEAAFGSGTVTRDKIAKAIAQFVRSMSSFESKFDRAASQEVTDGDYTVSFAAFSQEENFGKSLFIEGLGGIAELGCAVCHIPPTFGMPRAMNNGLDRTYKDPGLGALNRPSNHIFTPSNDGKFKASPLRNIALTAPYMHDGRFATLEAVIEHYSGGIHPHENLAVGVGERDPHAATFGFGYNAEQKRALVAFLKTLTDEAIISDPRFADPFVRSTP